MDNEKRDKRAKAMAAMGLVSREGDKFKVSTPSLRGKQQSYWVWREGSDGGKVKCTCLEFNEEFQKDFNFRCEHILSVKHFLVAKAVAINAELEQTEKVAQIASNEPLTPLPEGIRANVLDEVIRKIESMKLPTEFVRDESSVHLTNFAYDSVISEIKKMK